MPSFAGGQVGLGIRENRFGKTGGWCAMRAALYGAVIYVAISAGTLFGQGINHGTTGGEKPRLVPDPLGLEISQSSVNINQIGSQAPSGTQSSQSSGSSQKTPTADSSRDALGMTTQGGSQAGKPEPQKPEATSGGSNAAWKQDPAGQGGNFTPDTQALKSAQELDQKVGEEQAAEAAEDHGKAERDKGKDKKRKQKQKYDIEKIGNRGVGGGMNFYSLDREIEMGKDMADEVESSSKFLTDPVVNEYVNRLAQNLARNSDAKVPFTVKIIDSEELNAFALPGGHFYVNTGMILATESEAELAGIMAHEIAHVAARHATKTATKQQIWNMASIPLMFVGGPAAIAVRDVAQIAVPMSFMKFSRNAEREADLLGMEYEYSAGYDPVAMVNFFEKLQSQDKKRPNFVERAFQSHPMTDDRVKRAQKTIAELLPPKEDYLVTTSDYQAMKDRLSKLMSNRLRLGITKHDEGDKPTLRKNKWQTQPPPSLCDTIDEACPHRLFILDWMNGWRDQD
jgi:Zn-dependent protease with chaperone function